MKPSSLLPLLVLAAAAGCGPKRAEQQAKEEPAEANPEIYASLNQFAGALLAASAKQNPEQEIIVAPSSTYSLLAALMNSAENDTLEALSQAMAMEEPRTDKLNPALRHLRQKVEGKTGYHSAESVWFIWPILLDPELPGMVERGFGVKLTRLGSAGIDATRRVNEWIAESGFAEDFHRVALTKDDVYRSYSLVEVTASVPPGNPVMYAKGGLQMAQFDLGNGLRLGYLPLAGHELNASLFSGWKEDPSASAWDLKLPPIKAKQQTSMIDLLTSLGLAGLFTGPVDLRYLSVELQGMYPMADLEQSISVSIASTENEREPGERDPFIWAILEPETGAVLVCGIQR